MEHVLDETDYKIIEIMQKNARITMKTLAEQINMSSPAATERVRRLEEAGIFVGYRAEINPSKIGFRVSALFVVEVLPEKREYFQQLVEACPEIVECTFALSSSNIAVMRVYCRDYRHLIEVQKDFFEVGNCSTLNLSYEKIKNEVLDPKLGFPQEYLSLRKAFHSKEGR